MALPQIETGYKPEFALGALYQGQNAANANMAAEEELIKQFLANQKAQQMLPIDVAQAQQTLDSGAYKTRPEYQNAMTDIQVGQGMSNMAAGQTAKGLQPFKQAAEQGALEQQMGEQRNMAKIQEIDDILNDPDVKYDGTTKQQLMNARLNLINRFKETPKFAGQRELREMGSDSNEYIAELKRQQELEKARLAAGGKGANPPKTAEEALARQLTAKFGSGEIDYQTYMTELAKIFNSKNAAKVQEGTTLATDQLPPGTPLKKKEPQLQYTPGGTQQQDPIKSQVESAGISYEPNKYDYRVIDGKVQRKLKGT